MTGIPVWVVERDGATVYICGVRPICGDETWLTPSVEEALGGCEVFWCETPPATEFASMDETLADIAQRNGARIRTEFTADTVIRMFGEISVEMEADMLRFELDSLEPGPAQLGERYLRVINGNLAWDEAEAFHVASAYPELFDVILRHRNLAWGPRIDEALRVRVATFIAVGTLHLVGPDNVLSLLRDEVLPV